MLQETVDTGSHLEDTSVDLRDHGHNVRRHWSAMCQEFTVAWVPWPRILLYAPALGGDLQFGIMSALLAGDSLSDYSYCGCTPK